MSWRIILNTNYMVNVSTKNFKFIIYADDTNLFCRRKFLLFHVEQKISDSDQTDQRQLKILQDWSDY